MKRIGLVALIALLGVAMWWAVETRPGGGPVARAVARGPVGGAHGTDGTKGTIATTAAAPAGEADPVIPEPPEPPPDPLRVTAPPRTINLAGAEVLPAGPAPAPAPGPTTTGADSGAEPEAVLPPATALENFRAAFRQYAARLGGNPVGDNAEITAALTGGNPRQSVFVTREDGWRVNDAGQSIDSWGTPYFFHQLSRTEMEIRSAGPDRRMWTSDDLVVK